MGLERSSLLSLSIMLALFSSIDGLDITKLLGEHPEYAKFNKALTETKLVEQINKLKVPTILVLDDAAMGSLDGESQDTLKAILSTHILVDFYDEKKLMEAQGSHTKIETLFQSSGLAKTNQGFIYVALINEGEMAFGSAAAAPDAPFQVVLVTPVTNQPDTVSILQVNKPIVPTGIQASSGGSTTADTGSVAHSPSSSAPAPGPSSAASSLSIGICAALSLVASLLILSL